MRFWFDTEFAEDGNIIDLISIGVVSEDGRQYYAESKEFMKHKNRANSWVKANVLPHLTGPVKSRRTIANELKEFFGTNPEIWAYFASYDWVVLCQLYGPMVNLPPSWPMAVMDVRQLAMDRGITTKPPPPVQEHHALHDAQWTHDFWKYCILRGSGI